MELSDLLQAVGQARMAVPALSGLLSGAVSAYQIKQLNMRAQPHISGGINGGIIAILAFVSDSEHQINLISIYPPLLASAVSYLSGSKLTAIAIDVVNYVTARHKSE